MFKSLIGRINWNISLRYKLVIVFFLVSVIPISTLGLASYSISSRVVEQEVVSDNHNRLELIDNKVTQIIDDKQLTGIKLGLDRNVFALLGNENTLPAREKNKYEFEVQKLLYDYTYINGTESIRILSINNIIYTNTGLAGSQEMPGEWDKYESFIKSDKTFTWLDAKRVDGTPVVPLMRKIVNPSLKVVGLIVINMEESLLSDVYSDYMLNNPTTYCVVNKSGEIVSSLNKNLLGTRLYDSYQINFKSMSAGKGYFYQNISGVNSLVIYTADDVTGLDYLCIMPKTFMLEAMKPIKSLTFLLCAICLIICFLASLSISKSITRPIWKLISSVEDAQRGNPAIRTNKRRRDEIGRLEENYSSMIQLLKLSIENFYGEQKKKREAEVKALEFQINPHFLYNTLSSVIWMCEENDNHSAIVMTKALANFFRISISNGKEIIKISQELSHVLSYIEIQKMRYSDNFDAFFEIDPAIVNCFTPKLILQPLIENAIYHGIKCLNGDKGVICVRGRVEGGDIVFEIMDNGAGMSIQQAEKINQILKDIDTRSERKEEFGIGVLNVNDRIKLIFGGDYGLSFGIIENYTVATVKIQASKEEAEDV